MRFDILIAFALAVTSLQQTPDMEDLSAKMKRGTKPKFFELG